MARRTSRPRVRWHLTLAVMLALPALMGARVVPVGKRASHPVDGLRGRSALRQVGVSSCLRRLGGLPGPRRTDRRLGRRWRRTCAPTSSSGAPRSRPATKPPPRSRDLGGLPRLQARSDGDLRIRLGGQQGSARHEQSRRPVVPGHLGQEHLLPRQRADLGAQPDIGQAATDHDRHSGQLLGPHLRSARRVSERQRDRVLRPHEQHRARRDDRLDGSAGLPGHRRHERGVDCRGGERQPPRMRSGDKRLLRRLYGGQGHSRCPT